MSVSGQFFDGQSSNPFQATLELTPFEATLSIDGKIERYALSSVRISPRIGNTPRYIDLPEGARFETNDNDGIDQLCKQVSRVDGNRLIHKLESHLGVALASLFTILLFGAWLMLYGLPMGAKLVADRLPASILTETSIQTLEALDEYSLAETKLANERIEQLNQKMTSWLTEEGEFTFRLLFRQGNRLGANAFALPDGTIVMTDELVELAENDEQLIAVVAHERGHVVMRHGLRQVLQTSVVAVGVTLLSGDVSAFGNLATALPLVLISSSYSKEFEREADAYAAQQLQLRGLSPMLLGEMLTAMEEKHQHEGIAIPAWLSTHPATEERVKAMEDSSGEKR